MKKKQDATFSHFLKSESNYAGVPTYVPLLIMFAGFSALALLIGYPAFQAFFSGSSLDQFVTLEMKKNHPVNLPIGLTMLSCIAVWSVSSVIMYSCLIASRNRKEKLTR